MQQFADANGIVNANLDFSEEGNDMPSGRMQELSKHDGLWSENDSIEYALDSGRYESIDQASSMVRGNEYAMAIRRSPQAIRQQREVTSTSGVFTAAMNLREPFAYQIDGELSCPSIK